MTALLTLLLLFMAAASPALSLDEAGEVHTSTRRSLLAPIITPGVRPPVCLQRSDCVPVSVPPIAFCPKGTKPLPSATAPTTCLLDCPQGLQAFTDAAGKTWCVPKCPTGTSQVSISGAFLVCAKCDDKCQYSRRLKKCVTKCKDPFGSAYDTPPLNGACCNTRCPLAFPVLDSIGPPVVCATPSGILEKVDVMRCELRDACPGPVFTEIALTPRKETPPLKQCPPKPPAVLTVLSGGLVKDCIKCKCRSAANVGFPYTAANGDIKCSASSCPTGYTRCGPLCVRNGLAALLGGTPFDFTRCWQAVVSFSDCIKPCP